jgi:ribosomal protein S18 acetylase RimI-like enzyme
MADAFQDDPGLSYVVPEAKRRRAMLPRFFAVMIAQSFRGGEVLASPGGEAVSLYYPPGPVKDGALALLRDNLRLATQFGRALPRGLRVAAAMHAHHPDPQPYDYLRYVGVSKAAQGKGWGGAIVRAGIERAARQGRGVLLETATRSNVAIYTRLGFEIAEEWRVPGGGPEFWTMIHPAP